VLEELQAPTAKARAERLQLNAAAAEQAIRAVNTFRPSAAPNRAAAGANDPDDSSAIAPELSPGHRETSPTGLGARTDEDSDVPALTERASPSTARVPLSDAVNRARQLQHRAEQREAEAPARRQRYLRATQHATPAKAVPNKPPRRNGLMAALVARSTTLKHVPQED
jgi:hypothetical protein